MNRGPRSGDATFDPRDIAKDRGPAGLMMAKASIDTRAGLVCPPRWRPVHRCASSWRTWPGKGPSWSAGGRRRCWLHGRGADQQRSHLAGWGANPGALHPGRRPPCALLANGEPCGPTSGRGRWLTGKMMLAHTPLPRALWRWKNILATAALSITAPSPPHLSPIRRFSGGPSGKRRQGGWPPAKGFRARLGCDSYFKANTKGPGRTSDSDGLDETAVPQGQRAKCSGPHLRGPRADLIQEIANAVPAARGCAKLAQAKVSHPSHPQ